MDKKNTTDHGDNVFVLVEEYYPTKDKYQVILDIAKESAEGIVGVSGLILAQTLKPKKDNGPICNITTWESEQAFKEFMKSDAIKELYKSDMMNTVKNGTSEIKTEMYYLELGWHE